MKPVTCTDCKHNRASWISRRLNSSVFWECNGVPPTPARYDPSDGTTRPAYYTSCHAMRSYSQCGPEGKLWEPRNPKKRTFFLLKKDHNATA
jgi:hypothetical protein